MPNEIKTLENGKISAKLETGEIFEGDPLEVTTKLAEAHQATKRWGQDWKQKAENPAPPPPPPPPADRMETANWLADTLALKFGPGFTGDQLVNKVIANDAVLAQINQNNTIATFHSKCPDFPDTPEAADKVIARAMADFKIEDFDKFSALNPEIASKCLAASHRDCVVEGVYQALSPEQQKYAEGDAAALRQQRNPTPPPMINRGNPESGSLANDPYAIPLSELRQRAIREQLEGK